MLKGCQPQKLSGVTVLCKLLCDLIISPRHKNFLQEKQGILSDMIWLCGNGPRVCNSNSSESPCSCFNLASPELRQFAGTLTVRLSLPSASKRTRWFFLTFKEELAASELQKHSNPWKQIDRLINHAYIILINNDD